MQDRLYTGILWMVAATVGVFMAVMVVSTVRADAGSPAPATVVPCREFRLTTGVPAEVVDPAGRATRVARTTAASVRGTLRHSGSGGGYAYSATDSRPVIVTDGGSATSVLIFEDGDLSGARLAAVLECLS